MYFVIGDYAAVMLIAVLTVAGVRAVVWPGMDMVVAMFLGMALGMVIAMLLGLLLAPLLGMFQTMVPGMLIGMWGGMLFAMRDAMGAGSPSPGVATAVGALFGAILVLGIRTYDRSLQSTVGD
jgi:hypothetical protein